MTIIKRLHLFILKSFLPLFAMTFFIVLFIVLMQFLWRYIDDLVGKGLSMDVLAELFFYAAVSMVPMALPLAILLASLMTFGNLGEKFELTAMKASGISLLRVMAPLIVFISMIAIGAFFFQNDVLPKAQVKMWTLLFSMKQKSPEVEIPEGVFYDQIPGYNLYVGEKNQETGLLKQVMIYDVSKGGDNATILLSDSARIAFTKDNKYLYLHLYRGEQFENLRDQSAIDANVPFRREQFKEKEVLIPFDANFNRLDDQGMRKQYVGKNIAELRHTIDSVTHRVDSLGNVYNRTMLTASVAGQQRKKDKETGRVLPLHDAKMPPSALPLDSMLMALSETQLSQVYNNARAHVTNIKNEYEFKSQAMADDKKAIRRHEIELLKKFTLSVACLIFFFIGAPLGAIIRKGGLGTPLVISVLLFLVYYIIDNTGYKMARDGHWVVWFGMWISTFILGPLGIYVTYKAMNDSAVFDKDAYLNLLRRLLGRPGARRVEYKEVIINDISMPQAISMVANIRHQALANLRRYRRPMSYLKYLCNGYDIKAISRLATDIDATVNYLSDCRDPLVVNKLPDYPIVHKEWIYRPFGPKTGRVMAWLPFFGAPLWVLSIFRARELRHQLEKTASISKEILSMLSPVAPQADSSQLSHNNNSSITS